MMIVRSSLAERYRGEETPETRAAGTAVHVYALRPGRADARWSTTRMVACVALAYLCLSCDRPGEPSCAGGVRLSYRVEGDSCDAQEIAETIRRRLDRVGLARIRVLAAGSGSILVEVPGAERKDLRLVKLLCTSAGRLTFHVVEDFGRRPVVPNDAIVVAELPKEKVEVERLGLDKREIEEALARLAEGGVSQRRREGIGTDGSRVEPPGEDALQRILSEAERLQKEEPALKAAWTPRALVFGGLRVLLCPELRRTESSYEVDKDAATGNPLVREWHALYDDPERKVDCRPTEAKLEKAGADRRRLSLSLDAEGTARLREVTRQNLGREVAVVFDGTVLFVARLHVEIRDGRLELMPGTVPEWELKGWYGVLSGGVLPCGLSFESEDLTPETAR